MRIKTKFIDRRELDVLIIALVTILIIIAALSRDAFPQYGLPRIKKPDIKRTIAECANDPLKCTKGNGKKPVGQETITTDANGRTTVSGNGPGTANSSGNADDPPLMFVWISDIARAKEDVDSYTPEGKIYMVRSIEMPWLVRAFSKTARDAFAVEKKFDDWRKANPGNKWDAALDDLAASAAKKLPTYLPAAKNFAIRDANLEKMMIAKLKSGPGIKIEKIGIFHSAWQIEKNGLGIPENRYREAYIWGRDPKDEHPYCHLYGFVIQQDYSGGGTYGATWVYQNTDAIFGCPAGK